MTATINDFAVMLDDSALESVSAGYTKGERVSKYNIHRGTMYYFWCGDDCVHELALATSDNYEVEDSFIFIPLGTHTVVDLLWVTGPARGSTQHYNIVNHGTEIYAAAL